MIYVTYNKVTGQTEMVHYMPFDEKHGLGKTAEELQETGMLVESIPEAEERPGFIATLCVDVETKELYYTYEEAPLQEEDRFAEYDKRLSQQEEVINFLLLGGE